MIKFNDLTDNYYNSLYDQNIIDVNNLSLNTKDMIKFVDRDLGKLTAFLGFDGIMINYKLLMEEDQEQIHYIIVNQRALVIDERSTPSGELYKYNEEDTKVVSYYISKIKEFERYLDEDSDDYEVHRMLVKEAIYDRNIKIDQLLKIEKEIKKRYIDRYIKR